MTDVALVALITSSATVIVAVASALASWFGPGHQERARQRLAAEMAEEKRRFERANVFVEALLTAAGAHRSLKTRIELTVVWSQFASTLRSGEGAVSDFAKATMELVHQTKPETALDMAMLTGDTLFRWLRGELTISHVKKLADNLTPQAEALRKEKGVIVN